MATELNLKRDYIIQRAEYYGLDPERLNRLNLVISDIDNMYEKGEEYADEHYFNVGLQALALIENTRKITLKSEYSSILDFGCGFGRVLRFLKAYYTNAKLTPSELFSEYVEFCENNFDLKGFQSRTDFKAINTTQKYDLIWSGSVFTHLSSNKFDELFQYFEDSLEVGGIMCFTTHGRFCLKHLQSHAYGLDGIGKRKTQLGYLTSGYGYADYKNANGYGVSIMTLDWFAKYLKKKSNLRLVAINEKYWDEHQDAIVIQKMK